MDGLSTRDTTDGVWLYNCPLSSKYSIIYFVQSHFKWCGLLAQNKLHSIRLPLIFLYRQIWVKMNNWENLMGEEKGSWHTIAPCNIGEVGRGWWLMLDSPCHMPNRGGRMAGCADELLQPFMVQTSSLGLFFSPALMRTPSGLVPHPPGYCSSMDAQVPEVWTIVLIWLFEGGLVLRN